ncbi:MAG: glycosyltransferase family 4 protein [Candidatus Omnitrophota bacterium]
MARARNKLKILNIHWGFPPIIGGVETHLTILLPTMVKMGHSVSLLTGAFEGEKARSVYKGVNIYREPVMDLNWLGKRGFSGLTDEVRKMLSKIIDEVKPDCIHTHNMHYFSKAHAKTLEEICIKKGIPMFLTAHNVWDDNLFMDLMRSVKWAHVIAVSHFIKRELLGVGYNHKNVTVIHHGIDEKIFSPKINSSLAYRKYPVMRGRKVVFHPARMGLAKGCDVTIKALRIVKQKYPDVLLILGGTKNIIDWSMSQEKDIAYMVSLVKFFKLEKNVLIDSFPLDFMPGLYAASMVCVYPSSSCEPFGLTMLEALASGKPMIVTEAGGMPEIIKDGINGFVIPIKDFESLASRIIQLLGSNDLRDRFGITGRQIVEQNYTKETVTNATLRLYEKFC